MFELKGFYFDFVNMKAWHKSEVEREMVGILPIRWNEQEGCMYYYHLEQWQPVFTKGRELFDALNLGYAQFLLDRQVFSGD